MTTTTRTKTVPVKKRNNNNKRKPRNKRAAKPLDKYTTTTTRFTGSQNPIRKQPSGGMEKGLRDSVIALLTARDLLLPRAMPTYVNRISTHLTVNIADLVGMQVSIDPTNLLTPIKIAKSRVVNTPIAYTSTSATYRYKTFGEVDQILFTNNFINLYPATFVDTNQNLLAASSFSGIDVLRASLTLFGDELIPSTLSSFTKPEYFMGPLTDVTGTIVITTAAPTTIISMGDVFVRGFNDQGVLVDSLQLTRIPISTTQYNYTAPTNTGVAGEFWTIVYVGDPATNANMIPSIGLESFNVTIGGVANSVELLPPISSQDQNYWTDYINAAQRYSMTACSILVSNTQSSVADGGQIAAALFPTGSVVTSSPKNTIDRISSLLRQRYNGKFKTGAHVSYLADDISQYFFKPLGEKLYCPTPVIAAIAATSPNDNNVNTMSCLIQIQMTWEILTVDPTRILLMSPGHTALFEAMVRAIIELSRVDDQFSLAGCNPDHVTRIRKIASSVAKNPTVREHAAKAAKSFGKMAISIAPLLFGL